MLEAESTGICRRRWASGREHHDLPRRRAPPLPGPRESDRSRRSVSAPPSVPTLHTPLNLWGILVCARCRGRSLSVSFLVALSPNGSAHRGRKTHHVPTADRHAVDRSLSFLRPRMFTFQLLDDRAASFASVILDSVP